MLTKKSQKIANFSCDNCKYITHNKTDFNKHLLTPKHKNVTNVTNMDINNTTCKNCNKEYKSRMGLWYHKKKCFQENIIKEENLLSTKEIIPINNLIVEIVKSNNKIQKQNQEIINQNQEFKNLIKEPEEKENKIITILIEENQNLKDLFIKQTEFMTNQQEEFKNLIVEVCKNNQITNNTLINNNSNNKTFNLNVFLNEDCKDAMNITEFANSIVIGLEELESIGKLGYVNSITNIIKNKLNLLDIHKRPVHCTDLKRETIYIKDNNVWEKDTKNKFVKGIAVISKKNCSMIYIFKDKYPDYKNPTSKQSDVYDVLCSKIYHASDENIHKVIKKLLKEITIPK
jgi:hypothetical protein